MGSETVERLRAAVRDVPDFPKKGIVFKDITPVLSDPGLFRASIDLFLERCRGKEIDKIVGIDARGFLFGSAVAYELESRLCSDPETRQTPLQDRHREVLAGVRRGGNGNAYRRRKKRRAGCAGG